MARTDCGGCAIWYDAAGAGTPIVMVYGIGGNSRRWWRAFPEALASRHGVVMLDNRGTGRSDQPREPWTMEDMAADVIAVADAAGLSSLHLVGCSLGSLIARQVAASHPGRLRSLSLLCPPHGIAATSEDRRQAIMWDPELPRAEADRLSWPIVHPQSFIESHEAELLADFTLSEGERTPGRTFRFQMDAAASATDTLLAINDGAYPVGIFHGTADRLVPPANAEALHAAIPRSELHWLEGDSHSFWQHDADRAAALLLDFIDFIDRAESAQGAK